LSATAAAAPRVLVYSQRHSNRMVWQSTTYEFEDVIVEIDDAALHAPPGRELPLWHKAIDRARRRVAGPPWHRLVPMAQSSAVEHEVELFFAVFQFVYQLPLLSLLRDWRRRSRKAACLINELWQPDLQRHAAWLPALEQFDHVFVANLASVEPLQRRLQVPVSYLRPAVQAERLCPYPDPPPRVIDCYSIGRRSPGVHAALLQAVERERLTYVYDTMPASRVLDWREHRLLAANLSKRSRYFLSFRLNDNAERIKKTGGEEGLALRFFEGAAAGTVILGSRPQCAEHDACFDWPASTVEIAFDGSDVRDVMRALDGQPERLARIRRDNVVQSLRRHDWLYRWQQVLDTLRLPHTPAMALRAARLEHLAQRAMADGQSRAAH
jgi:hypothetical protein